LRLADARTRGIELPGQLLGLTGSLGRGRLPHGRGALQLLSLAVAELAGLLGPRATLGLPRAGLATRRCRFARHESEMAAARSAGEDLEAGRRQLPRQPSLAELLGVAAIDGGAKQGVRDPTMRRCGGSMPLAREQISGPGDERVQLGALTLQRFGGRPRIPELGPAHVLHAIDEPREPLGILVGELIGSPQRRTRAP
jgi:hypothetical protein